jgi:hypothetical protein
VRSHSLNGCFLIRHKSETSFKSLGDGRKANYKQVRRNPSPWMSFLQGIMHLFDKGYAMTKSCDGVMLMRCPKVFLWLDSTCASVALC